MSGPRWVSSGAAERARPGGFGVPRTRGHRSSSPINAIGDLCACLAQIREGLCRLRVDLVAARCASPKRVAVVACALAALTVSVQPNAAAAAPGGKAAARAAAYLQGQQQLDGGFAEPGTRSDPALTAWAVLALDAAGVDVATLRHGGATPAEFLEDQPYRTVTDLELRIIALASLGRDPASLLVELDGLRRTSGRIGPALNSTIWGILALSSAGEPVPNATVRFLKRNQHASGGFSWFPGGPPDTNDTAAAIQALRAAGVPARARVIRRAIRYLTRLRHRSGGFPLAASGTPDTQSTAWVLQGFRAAARKEPKRARRYLKAQQRSDGRFRYRPGRTITPVWVTAQALPALAGRPFPLGR